MLKKYAQVFISILFIADLISVVFSWLAAFFIRFVLELFPLRHTLPVFSDYLIFLLFISIVFPLCLLGYDLYKPMRGKKLFDEFVNIFKAVSISIVILTAITFFYRENSYSRIVMLLFWLLSIITITLSRFYLRRTLKYFREKGYNLRHVLIVGAGDLAKNLAEKINLHPEIGFNIVGFLTDHSDKVGQSVSGKKILGQLEEVQKIVREYKIDQLFIALPRHAHDRLEKVISYLGEEFVDIKVVPDLLQFMRINPGIEDMDGLPIVSLSEGPLYGWNKLFKRFADILASLIMLIVMSPAITIIAIAIKLTSKGPLLYNQERMGFSGRHFTMYKFRTMFEDAEKKTGAIWAKKGDSRTTSIGKLLRKTSLDEFPQFFNVLKGDMSIVGPRPERPVFVNDFKKSVYQYMLRHKMKAGITGWAQVNGWRGDSSLEKRIEYDLYYIENWSFLFDLKIIWLTFWKGLINKNAY